MHSATRKSLALPTSAMDLKGCGMGGSPCSTIAREQVTGRSSADAADKADLTSSGRAR